MPDTCIAPQPGNNMLKAMSAVLSMPTAPLSSEKQSCGACYSWSAENNIHFASLPTEYSLLTPFCGSCPCDWGPERAFAPSLVAAPRRRRKTPPPTRTPRRDDVIEGQTRSARFRAFPRRPYNRGYAGKCLVCQCINRIMPPFLDILCLKTRGYTCTTIYVINYSNIETESVGGVIRVRIS
jgi:hypothetical protein